MRVVLFRENLENVKGRGRFREICGNFLVSGGILPIIRKFGRLPNDSGDLATLVIVFEDHSILLVLILIQHACKENAVNSLKFCKLDKIVPLKSLWFNPL